MNIEKTSPEFEAWLKERFWHECYEDVKHHLFAAWQASRESLVIELPDSDEPGYHSPGGANQNSAFGYNQALEQCREAIHATGVKTK